MRFLAGLIFTPIYYIVFGLLLGVFHPVQVIARRIGGYELHKKSVCTLNYLLIRSLYIIGARISFEGMEKLPRDRPLIVTSNHQSFLDIPAFVDAFAFWHPKFVSKIELGKGIPSISYNLRHSGSARIDRSNGGQAIREIIRLSRYIEANNYAVCIYPEGTRSSDGIVKPFQSAGIKSLLKAAPSSLVVPFVIKGHSDLIKWGMYPLQFGVKLSYKALDAIDPAGRPAEDLVRECEIAIKRELGQL